MNPDGSFHWLDYSVVFGYLAVSLGLGFAMRRQSNREEFFTASRSMGRITVGLSVMATLFSANSFVMYPSAAYGNSLRVLMAVVAFWAMGPFVIWVFIPVYAKLNCNTAYEYLEKRFHVSVRCLASCLFVLARISWMAAATYAASEGISGIAGINQFVVIIGLGVVAIAYTMLGGLRAVMWTDVLQFFVFFGTILFAACLLISQTEGGASRIIDSYFEGRENMLFDFSLDPTLEFATLAILIGSFVEGLSAFGADQVAVQRYIAAKDMRTSQTGFLITLLGLLIVLPGLLVIGMGLFHYFKLNPDDMTPVVLEEFESSDSEKVQNVRSRLQARVAASSSEFGQAATEYYRSHPAKLHADVVEMGLNDQAMPRFVRLKFPPGVVGLLVAALMAATMSSVDSGIHSVTTALLVDFRDRLFPNLRPSTEAGEMLAARSMVLVIGILAITLACFVGQLGDVFTVAKKTISAFAAPLLAVFIAGLFIRRTTSFGVFLGTWLGAVFTLVVMYVCGDWFSMWFFPIGFFGSVGLSVVFSFLPVKANRRSGKPPLTFWNIRTLRAESTPSDDIADG